MDPNGPFVQTDPGCRRSIRLWPFSIILLYVCLSQNSVTWTTLPNRSLLFWRRRCPFKGNLAAISSTWRNYIVGSFFKYWFVHVYVCSRAYTFFLLYPQLCYYLYCLMLTVRTINASFSIFLQSAFIILNVSVSLIKHIPTMITWPLTLTLHTWYSRVLRCLKKSHRGGSNLNYFNNSETQTHIKETVSHRTFSLSYSFKVITNATL